MAHYGCTVEWSRGDAPFATGKYSRAHEWRFDGGAVVRASASPQAVRVPWSDPAAVDPEEALVAAVSCCHMLWFLAVASERTFVVDRYTDHADGVMGRFDDGREGITEVVLRPRVLFSGATQPDDAAVDALHHAAHERCYIANSVRSAVRVEGSWSMAR